MPHIPPPKSIYHKKLRFELLLNIAKGVGAGLLALASAIVMLRIAKYL